MARTLYILLHHHSHGVSPAILSVPAGKSPADMVPDDADTDAWLVEQATGEDHEPGEGDWVEIIPMDIVELGKVEESNR